MRNIAKTIWHYSDDKPIKDKSFLFLLPDGELEYHKKRSWNTVFNYPWTYTSDLLKVAARGEKLRILQSQYQIRNRDKINEKQRKKKR